MSLESLPSEVLLNVARHIDVVDIKSLYGVSQHFRTALLPVAWRKADIGDYDHIQFEDLAWAKKLAKGLPVTRLHFNRDIDDERIWPLSRADVLSARVWHTLTELKLSVSDILGICTDNTFTRTSPCS